MPDTTSKLSTRQQEALDKLRTLPSGKWECSYTLRVSIRTLEALERRGLVESLYGLGSIYSPRISIEWRIPPNARQTLHHHAR